MRRESDASVLPIPDLTKKPATTSATHREKGFRCRRRTAADWRLEQSRPLARRGLSRTLRQATAELIETLSFQLIGHLVQPSGVDTRAQTHSARAHHERRVLRTGLRIRQAAAYSLVQGFLETLPPLLHCITKQLFDIRI